MFKIVNVVVTLILLFIFFLFISETQANEIKELQMNNDAGGVIVITVEDCAFPEAEEMGFNYRAYATESNGVVHEGCWMEPDMTDAPKSNEMMKIIRLVNIYFDGMVIPYDKQWFNPEPSHKNPQEGKTWI